VRLNENLLMSLAGLGAVSAFFGSVILLAIAAGGFSFITIWGISGISFLVLGIASIAYSVYLSSNTCVVLAVAVLIFVGGVLSNMAYDFSSRVREGNSFSFQVVAADGSVYTLGSKSFALFSAGSSTNLGSSCMIRFDARLKLSDPPGSIPLPEFSVDRTMYVKLDGESYYGMAKQGSWFVKAPYVTHLGSDEPGWEYASDGSVARCQTGSMPLDSFSLGDVSPNWDKVYFCYSVIADLGLGPLGSIQSEPYEFYVHFNIGSDAIYYIGSGSGCPVS